MHFTVQSTQYSELANRKSLELTIQSTQSTKKRTPSTVHSQYAAHNTQLNSTLSTKYSVSLQKTLLHVFLTSVSVYRKHYMRFSPVCQSKENIT